ncbi:MAG: mannonate dehydratase [Planctomycetota bacterium]|nr:mannonate dehydratase [Planctomycetota bacterium]MDA1179781.1 mannonate dehydratase [Planctomycetota bacterium]
MRLATVLTPISDAYLQVASQCGVQDVVHRYPGSDPGILKAAQRRIAKFGLRLGVVEGYLPIEAIKLGQDDGTELLQLSNLIREMGDLGIPLLCYNFMAGTDWVRTQTDVPERGRARVSAFRLADAERAILLGRELSSEPIIPSDLTATKLWSHLERLLIQLMPIAEQAGVTLAMHPDDPPLGLVAGRPRIMHCVESFERLVQLVPSPRNAICFCQGTFAAMGVDIPATIRQLGPHIKYVHFRDVRGSCDDFVETFHDNGPTDMAAAMRAYQDIRFNGPMRPDHVPQLVGEDEGEPGYTMLGRLFAFGYMRGLMHGTDA